MTNTAFAGAMPGIAATAEEEHLFITKIFYIHKVGIIAVKKNPGKPVAACRDWHHMVNCK
jgi:hypothetical protein